MKIRILAVGRLKSPVYFEVIQDYLGRLKNFVHVRIEEVRDFPLRKGMSSKIVNDQEGEFLKERLKDDSFYVVLDVKGKHKSSEEFSELLAKWENSAVKEVTFILGGAFGVSDELLRNAREKISLSKMTFTHEMARLFLSEQIYRAYTILRGVPYHHG